MNNPILICGCPGGGTSLVTKMLRYAGMFAGADAGPCEARKYHESNAFVEANRTFLNQTIAFPHAPKSALQFTTHIERSGKDLVQLASLVDKEDLLANYWAGAQRNTVWGWKDPRNSANALIWRSLFPELRVLVIHRKWSRTMRAELGKSDAGIWFRKESTKDLRRLYYDPPGIEGLDRFDVDFDRLIEGSAEFEATLRWCGLSDEPLKDYRAFLEQVGLES